MCAFIMEAQACYAMANVRRASTLPTTCHDPATCNVSVSWQLKDSLVLGSVCLAYGAGL